MPRPIEARIDLAALRHNYLVARRHAAINGGGAKAWAGVDAQGLREDRWYMVNKDGMPTLCADKKDAEREAAFSDKAWPRMAPHRVVQLVEAGRASLSANAGEPVAEIMFSTSRP